jgi:hypothetical protein
MYSILWTDGYKDDPEWWNNINNQITHFNQPAIINGLESILQLIESEYFHKENYPLFCYGLKASWGSLEIFMQELFTGATSPEVIVEKMNNNFKKDVVNREIID